MHEMETKGMLEWLLKKVNLFQWNITYQFIAFIFSNVTLFKQFMQFKWIFKIPIKLIK